MNETNFEYLFRRGGCVFATWQSVSDPDYSNALRELIRTALTNVSETAGLNLGRALATRFNSERTARGYEQSSPLVVMLEMQFSRATALIEGLRRAGCIVAFVADTQVRHEM